jgi:hypothetical protein
VFEAVLATSGSDERLDRAGIDFFHSMGRTEKVPGVGHIRPTGAEFTGEHLDDIIASARIGRRRQWSKFRGVTS